MPVEEVEQAHNLVRRVKTVRGELCFRMLCAPRFDYGRASHRVEQQEGQCFFLQRVTIALPCACTPLCRSVFTTAMPLPSLPCGLMSTLSLSWSGHTLGSLAGDSTRLCVALFQEHHQFLAVLDWALDLPGRWREMVNRAALTSSSSSPNPTVHWSQHRLRPARTHWG